MEKNELFQGAFMQFDLNITSSRVPYPKYVEILNTSIHITNHDFCHLCKNTC